MLRGSVDHGPAAAFPTAAPLQLPFRVTVCGIDELASHRDALVSHLLSILDPDWPAPGVFGRFGENHKLELRFNDVIDDRPGSVAPDAAHIRQLLDFGAGLDREYDAHLLVHCHAGISRSSASMALLIARAMPDQPGESIFAEIMRIRPQIWPNLRIVELGDQALGRNGDLIAAAHRVYGFQLGKRPELAAAFRSGGRGREVEAALREPEPAAN
nr:protein-tyrosine-phosphatase [uncultured Rhodopila sp.]